MSRNGFSLVELIVTIAVMSTLLAIATMQFNSSSKKTQIETEVRELYIDLMDARSQAFLLKTQRSFGVTATGYKVYPQPEGHGTPLVQKTVKQQVTFNYSEFVNFDSRGVATAVSPLVVCVEPAGNAAVVDSIMMSQTMIQIGKRTGNTCDVAHFSAGGAP
jgi:prepilin-type N-terminal cleavage/methylation domain-containing protein